MWNFRNIHFDVSILVVQTLTGAHRVSLDRVAVEDQYSFLSKMVGSLKGTLNIIKAESSVIQC